MNAGTEIVAEADEGWKDRAKSGFGSGEAIIALLATGDAAGAPYERNGENGKSPDPRLLIQEPEFAQILKSASKEGSTMSPVLGNGWEGKPLQSHTRGRGSLEAKDGHLSVLAGITPEELTSLITKIDVANGFLNRFLIVEVDRPWLLPDPPQEPANLRGPHL